MPTGGERSRGTDREEFAYHTLDRPKSAKTDLDGSTSTVGPTLAYGFDALGNLTSKTSDVAADADDRVVGLRQRIGVVGAAAVGDAGEPDDDARARRRERATSSATGRRARVSIGGADPDSVDVYGTRTIVFAAIMNSRLDNVWLRVEAGADLGARDAGGETPLLATVGYRNYEIAANVAKVSGDGDP